MRYKPERQRKPKKYLAEEFGQEIADRRAALGITQTEASETLKVSQEAWSSYETGVNTPPFYRLKQIADLLDCKISELFVGAENRLDRS